MQRKNIKFLIFSIIITSALTLLICFFQASSQIVTAVENPNGAIPSGSIQIYSGPDLPVGYLLADGSAVSRTTYNVLFATIGTTYGSGNGSTTFNLPNLNGRFAVGKNTADTSFDVLGKSGGAKNHVLTTTEIPSHTHAFSGTTTSTTTTGSAHTHSYGPNVLGWPVGGSGGAAYAGWQDPSTYGNYLPTQTVVSTGGTHTHTVTAIGTNSNVGSNTAHNNLQPYIVLKYLIKYL